MNYGLYSGLGGLFWVIYLITIGVSIYCLVLFIKLALRGIKALDYYNAKYEGTEIDKKLNGIKKEAMENPDRSWENRE